MLWLVGPAGVGKSAIMQTVAENASESNLLAALFFSAPNGRNDPRGVITTLAYQLAARYPPYHNYVRAMITADPKVLEKSIDGQFTEFIVKPFAVRQLLDGTHQALIFIDGLDECKGQQEQLLLLSLISSFITNFPNEEVPVDSPEACQDVERFVRAEFAKIREFSSVIMSHFPDWPCERLLLKLLASAQGLFAYADTATPFIAERDHISRFRLVLDLIDQPSSFTSSSSARQPLSRLDALYYCIVAQVDPDDLKYARQVFFLLFPPFIASRVRPSQSLICDWLEISSDVLHNSLCRLHSVLKIPPPRLYWEQIASYHKSFYDFIHRMKLQLDLPMNENDAVESYRQYLLKVLSRIPLSEILGITHTLCPVGEGWQGK
ncbi:hypothetical protein NP233_g10932 [Leucocoprinus birnbaumii]|uniref:NACHT domain-containing protein n=1 Tax=Leucocoprinus birnbaumii TaxID=56174 RepID=A0AAD5VIA5_9AGAR|nr:hypothetical protein NP233_g10932 [Leucocoprinus birnbaumii]